MAPETDITRPSGPRKRERHAPDARRRALIDATLQCLRECGVEQTSVRRICERASVSVGLVNHYYASKDALIADAYAEVADNLLGALVAEVERHGGCARARLSAFFRASFSPVVLDPDLLRVWLSFWGMAYRSEAIADVHDRTYRDQLAVLEGMLDDLVREEEETDLDARLGAIGLAGLLDGLWVEWCLNARTFTPEEGVRLCEACLDGMLRRLPRNGATP